MLLMVLQVNRRGRWHGGGSGSCGGGSGCGCRLVVRSRRHACRSSEYLLRFGSLRRGGGLEDRAGVAALRELFPLALEGGQSAETCLDRVNINCGECQLVTPKQKPNKNQYTYHTNACDAPSPLACPLTTALPADQRSDSSRSARR